MKSQRGDQCPIAIPNARGTVESQWGLDENRQPPLDLLAAAYVGSSRPQLHLSSMLVATRAHGAFAWSSSFPHTSPREFLAAMVQREGEAKRVRQGDFVAELEGRGMK